MPISRKPIVSSTAPTVGRQYNTYINLISNRKQKPAKKSTLARFHCYFRKWICPAIGHMEVSQVREGEMKELVARWIEAGLSASTIAGVTHVVKAIVNSVIDENGDQIYHAKWNAESIGAPIVKRKKKLKQIPEIF